MGVDDEEKENCPCLFGSLTNPTWIREMGNASQTGATGNGNREKTPDIKGSREKFPGTFPVPSSMALA